MPVRDWRAQWDAVRAAILARAAAERLPMAEVFPTFEIAPPATEDEVHAVERELGQPIPSSFRRVLRKFAARVDLEWEWPLAMPETLRGLSRGGCHWDLGELPALQRTHRQWIDGCFTARHWADSEKPPYLI